jgi:hypothetical protein
MSVGFFKVFFVNSVYNVCIMYVNVFIVIESRVLKEGTVLGFT